MAAGRGRTGRARWRDGRPTLPARRRRRRSHRRDTPRGGDYQPVQVNADTAQRGVSARLFAATALLMVTLLCVLAMLAGTTVTFGIVAGAATGFCASMAAIALLLSARREESLHRLANEPARALLTAQPPNDGTDGELEKGIEGTDGSV